MGAPSEPTLIEWRDRALAAEAQKAGLEFVVMDERLVNEALTAEIGRLRTEVENLRRSQSVQIQSQTGAKP